MKKISIIILTIISIANAQSIRLLAPSYAAPGLMTAQGTDVTNDTIFYCSTDLLLTFENGIVDVMNNTGSPMNIMVRRLADDRVCFASNQFCWTICHAATVSLSDTLNVAANDTTHLFHGWVTPDGTEGCCYIEYKFFNAADTTESANVVVKYCFASVCTQDVGIDDHATSSIHIYPNPTSEQVQISNIPESLEMIDILDMQGKQLRTINNAGENSNLNIGVGDLKPGVYIIRFWSAGKPTEHRKILIN